MKPIIVNLYGGPGSGKSTAMAYIFSQLKMQGVECEMVSEFAKELYYEGNEKAFSEQVYIFGVQYYRIAKIADEVDLIITDSPIFISTVYNNLKYATVEFEKFIVEINKKFNNINYYLERKSKYSSQGRHQNEDQANKVANDVRDKLDQYGLEYKVVPATREDLDKIVQEIYEIYNK